MNIDKQEFQEIVLEQIHFFCHHRMPYLGEFTRESLAIDIEHMASDLDIYLTGKGWGKTQKIEHIGRTVTVYPSWWQHLKARLGLKHKSESVEETTMICLVYMCPHIDSKFPPDIKHITFPILTKEEAIERAKNE